MPDYLLEIGTEELPAGFVPEAQERLKTLMTEALGQANLSCAEILVYGTPRRLTCVVKQLLAGQETVQKKVKGPPVKSSFDAQGQALPSATGFAQKQGLKIEDLQQEEIGGVIYLVANLTIEGKSAAQVLQQIVPRVIEQISGERLMRWGSSDFKFSRPIRWLVSLLDHEQVELAVNGIKSGADSFGHRILAPGKVKVGSVESYVHDLRAAFVLVDPAERRQVIQTEVAKTASAVKGHAHQLKGALLDEVVNITEWPAAVLGQFETEYLDLPDTLIETVMVHHQRYFPIEGQQAPQDSRHKLLPYFVTIANNDRAPAAPIIKRGNERVLAARLADGRFFYFDDQKTKLSERKDALAQLTFHEGLGNYQDKQLRLVKCARALSAALKLDAKTSVCLERTLELSKLDLVTSLVRELPELQGHVGSWYAEQEGQPPDVVAALVSHYAPRSTDDSIPADLVGRFASVIDKLDNLVSVFAMGKRPSGSSDPYILRRQAQGVIDILVDGLESYPVNVTQIIEQLAVSLQPWLDAHKGKASAQEGNRDLREFLTQRLRFKLLEKNIRREVVDAVLSAGDPLADLPDVAIRCACVERLFVNADGLSVVKAGVRVSNILNTESEHAVKPELMKTDAEKNVWKAFHENLQKLWCKNGEWIKPSTTDDYQRLLGLLVPLAQPIDQLFDQVMINDPDQDQKNNRHGMLWQIDRYFKAIADFGKLQTLLP